jgi:hypothetical protein
MAVVAAMLLFPALASAQDDGARGKAVDDVAGLFPDGLILGGPGLRPPPPGTPGYEATREFIASLVASKAFTDAMSAIAKDNPKIRREAYAAKLAVQAYDAVSAGVVLLPPSDIEFLLHNDLRIMTVMNRQRCARAAATLQLYDAGGAWVDAFPRTLAITRTAYLGGLASGAGPPLPTSEQVSEARLAALDLVAGEQRDVAAAWAGNGRTLTDEETCSAALAYRTAVLALPGAPGEALRRHTVVEGVRRAMASRYHLARARTTVNDDWQKERIYPEVALQDNIEGTVVVRVGIDEKGSATDVRVIERKFNKPSIVRGGAVVTVADIFDPVAIAHARAMKYDVKREADKAVKWVGEFTVTWKLNR